MKIEQAGVAVFPRYAEDPLPSAPPAPLALTVRLPSGVPGLDALLGLNTRGSEHDRGTFSITLAKGGMRVGAVTSETKRR